MTGSARINGRTRAQIVWDALHEAPAPLTLAQVKKALIAVGITITHDGVVKQLYALNQRKHIQRSGKLGQSVYTASGPRPIDRRPEGAGIRLKNHHERLLLDSSYRDEIGRKITAGKVRPEKDGPQVQRKQGRPPPLPTLATLLKTHR